MNVVHIQPPAPIDPLGEVLHMLRLEGTLYCRAELGAPCGVALPRMDNSMMFIVVISGAGWMRMGGGQASMIRAGTMVVFPRGAPVDFISEPGVRAVPLFDLPAIKVSERYEIMEIAGDGPVTRTMTGVVSFAYVAAQRLIDLLPEVLIVDRWHEAADSWLRSTLDLISHEAATLKPGGEAMITRLADILIIQAIRSWLDTAEGAKTGWLSALRDPQIGRALVAIHRGPETDWTLERLAALAGMSRSGFAARFTEMVGQPAMRYLTDWRLQRARLALMSGRDSIGQVARNAGYQSEAAFGRAFKQLFGTPPGSLRRAG